MKQLKKLCCILLISLFFVFLVPVVFPNITGNSYTVQAASKIKLNTTKKTLIKGNTYTLKVKNTKKKAKWSTSNKKVATVNSKGKVTAVGKGTATIKAKIGKKTYSCKIKVEAPSISKKTLYITQGATYTLKMNGTSQSVKWSSSNKKIATVTSKGKVKAVKKGTATIKAKISSKTYSCKVIVETPSISSTKLTLVKGTTSTLSMKSTKQSIKWSSSNKKIATVTSKGKVTAIAKGTATIKAKVGSKTYSCKITVEDPSISKTTHTMIKGNTYILKMNGTKQAITWSSSNSKVATIDSKGKVSAISKGTVTIRAKIGSKTYSCKITVEDPYISKTTYIMIKGNTYTLKMNGTTQAITWSSSNSKVATIDSKGKVSAISKGTVTIKAKIGSNTYSCKITVEAPSFDKSTLSIDTASNMKNPLNGTTKNITYNTSNAAIARVTSNGLIYGIKAGSTTITASVDGKVFTCSVTVKKDSSISGYKPLCEDKYYYKSGIPVTGLQIINNKKCFFNVDGRRISEFSIDSKFGIDVSEFQKDIDWNKVKASGVEFAIIRCGYGMDEKNQDDSKFERNVTECERLGIPYGLYLYSYADTVKRADSEADHALRLVKGHTPTLGIWYDIEDKSTSNISKSLRTKIIDTFCKKIQDNGYKTGVYANLNWLNNKIETSIKDKYSIWVAQYYSKCEYSGKYEIWQFSSSGTINGIKGNIDCNIMYKID